MPARTLLALSLTAWLAGCQSVSYSPSGSAYDMASDDPMAGAPPITRGLDAEGLSTLLIAEMAGQRGDYRRATEGYLAAAERYRSPALVERATLAARFTDDTALIERAARSGSRSRQKPQWRLRFSATWRAAAATGQKRCSSD